MILSFHKFFTAIVLVMVSINLQAQLTDLARLEYSFIPKTRSEDQYMRLRALLNYPIKTSEDSYFVVGAEYNRIILNLEDDYPFDTALTQVINVIDLNFAYTFKTDENWRLGFKFNPRIASTLTTTLTSDDFFLNGGVFAINDRTKDDNLKRPYRLILGLTYNATAGIPFPLPFISYYRRINEKVSFNAGIPKSNLKYFFTEKSMLQAFVGLDGYFAHLQTPQMLNGRQLKYISLSVAVAGLGYEYNFSKHLIAYIYTGYTLRLSNALRDEDREVVFKLDNINSFYLRTGLKFKI